jgi:sortase (surface protein transpeptidase)
MSARMSRLLPVYLIAALAGLSGLALFLVSDGGGSPARPAVAPAPLTDLPVTADGIPVKGTVLAHPEKVLGGKLPKHPIKMPPGLRVVIPSIGVDATMLKLGLNSDGSLMVPEDVHLTGWWGGGPYPGDPGPAVIVGHVDSYKGPGVFYRLRDLKTGAQVYVSRPDGTVAVFRVDSMMEVPKTQFPTQRVYAPTPVPGLRLVTCGGVFNHDTGHYLDNIIVFAHLVKMATV